MRIPLLPSLDVCDNINDVSGTDKDGSGTTEQEEGRVQRPTTRNTSARLARSYVRVARRRIRDYHERLLSDVQRQELADLERLLWLADEYLRTFEPAVETYPEQSF